MLKTIMLVAALIASTVSAYPQQDRPLNVGEAIGVANGLREIKEYRAQDKEGKIVALSNKFDSATLWKMATNIQRGDAVSKTFQPILTELVVKYANGTASVPPEKMPEYQAEVKKLLEQPSQVLMLKLKKSELKLDTNQVSAEALSLILPVMADD